MFPDDIRLLQNATNLIMALPNLKALNGYTILNMKSKFLSMEHRALYALIPS